MKILQEGLVPSKVVDPGTNVQQNLTCCTPYILLATKLVAFRLNAVEHPLGASSSDPIASLDKHINGSIRLLFIMNCRRTDGGIIVKYQSR